MDTVVMFQFAKLYNFYHHPLAVLTRILILVLVLALLINSLQQNISINFPAGIIMLFLMTEFFVKGKLTILRPKKTVQEAQKGEVYETFTLPAASVLLLAHDVTNFVKALTKKKDVQFVLARAKIENAELTAQPVNPEELASLAYALARDEEKPYVTVLDLLGAYLLATEGKTKLLFQKELKKEDVLTILAFAQSVFPSELTISLPKVKPWGAGIGESWVSGWTLETQKYTQDFTRKSLYRPPISVGREKEQQQLIELLLKSRRTNVLIIGEPGVGRRELVAMFAVRSFLGSLPRGLNFLRVLELLSGSLVAGAVTSGELEERLHNILAEVAHAGDVVLYIPEIQNIAGAGSDRLDVTGVLLPHLLGDRIRVIATVTPANYKAFLERRTEFVDAFEKIVLDEPSLEKAVPMLLDASLDLEARHGVLFTYKAVVAAADLSKKYMPDRFLPGKGVTLLDEVGARLRLLGKVFVEPDDITKLLEEKLPVKIGKPKEKERELLLNLEEVLHTRIIDQEEAVKTVSEAMRRLRSGLAFEGRPAGVFLFLGPTGVGKTETAKALASVYFGSDEAHSARASTELSRTSSGQAMIRFDMGEYQDRAMASRLIDELTEKVRGHPFSLILLDEFEKAYVSLLDLFLSVFEDGRLTDSMGRTVSFVNTIIIATSNAGSELIREAVASRVALESMKRELLESLQQSGIFKPELLNRFDAVVLFKPLGEKEIAAVTQLLLQKVAEALNKKDITLQFDKRAVAKIAKEGFDETMGARPLRRFIQDHVEDLLSKKLLADEVKRGDIITLSTDNTGNLTLDVKSSA